MFDELADWKFCGPIELLHRKKWDELFLKLLEKTDLFFKNTHI